MPKSSVETLIDELIKDWAEPRIPQYMIDANAALEMPMQCTAARESLTKDIFNYPTDLADFWRAFHDALLFHDVKYGQWGLRLLSQADAKSETESYFLSYAPEAAFGDIVVGMFVGDLELLVMRADRTQDDFGSLLVLLPTSPRREWYRVSDSLSEFLEIYSEADGQKFWETQYRSS